MQVLPEFFTKERSQSSLRISLLGLKLNLKLRIGKQLTNHTTGMTIWQDTAVLPEQLLEAQGLHEPWRPVRATLPNAKSWIDTAQSHARNS